MHISTQIMSVFCQAAGRSVFCQRSGLFPIKLVHRSVDTLETEGRDNLRGHFETLIDGLFLLFGPFAEDEIDLRAAGIFIADTESYACVRVRS